MEQRLEVGYRAQTLTGAFAKCPFASTIEYGAERSYADQDLHVLKGALEAPIFCFFPPPPPSSPDRFWGLRCLDLGDEGI